MGSFWLPTAQKPLCLAQVFHAIRNSQPFYNVLLVFPTYYPNVTATRQRFQETDN